MIILCSCSFVKNNLMMLFAAVLAISSISLRRKCVLRLILCWCGLTKQNHIASIANCTFTRRCAASELQTLVITQTKVYEPYHQKILRCWGLKKPSRTIATIKINRGKSCRMIGIEKSSLLIKGLHRLEKN